MLLLLLLLTAVSIKQLGKGHFLYEALNGVDAAGGSRAAG